MVLFAGEVYNANLNLKVRQALNGACLMARLLMIMLFQRFMFRFVFWRNSLSLISLTSGFSFGFWAWLNTHNNNSFCLRYTVIGDLLMRLGHYLNFQGCFLNNPALLAFE